MPQATMNDRLRPSVRRFLDLDFDTRLAGDGEATLPHAKARLEERTGTFPDLIR